MKNHAMDWILRLIKGVFIGTGFILPGVSGGALAAIFGLYERMISFMAHITKDFKANFLFFLPVGIGMLTGIVLLSYPLSYFLDNHAEPTMWFFIGAILGTLPSLWKEAGKKARTPKHFIITGVAFLLALLFLVFGARLFDGQIPQNTGTWLLAGVIIALGVLVPGLSPSNFLLYMGMYASMTDAFKTLDFIVILPILIGMAACLLAFSKLMDKLFAKAHAVLFHAIFGIVLASTAIIIPLDYQYTLGSTFICIITVAGGIFLGYWMSHLEARYKPTTD